MADSLLRNGIVTVVNNFMVIVTFSGNYINSGYFGWLLTDDTWMVYSW